MRYHVKELRLDPAEDRYLNSAPYKWLARLMCEAYHPGAGVAPSSVVIGVYDSEEDVWV